jgi:hypothetical protein
VAIWAGPYLCPRIQGSSSLFVRLFIDRSYWRLHYKLFMLAATLSLASPKVSVAPPSSSIARAKARFCGSVICAGGRFAFGSKKAPFPDYRGLG